MPPLHLSAPSVIKSAIIIACFWKYATADKDCITTAQLYSNH